MKTTFRFRLRDTCDAELRRQARSVNQVWNFCEESQRHAIKWGKKWPTGYDLQKLTAGSSKELGLHAHTIQRVCHHYEDARKKSKRRSLRWRVSDRKSSKYSLGWVPFSTGHVTYRDGGFVFRGRHYRAWISYELKEGQKFGAGCFSQDSRGNWYINLFSEIDPVKSYGVSALGVDLGLKEFATLSTGEKVENPRWYRAMQERIATAQRAKKKRQVRNIHARIKAQRRDFHHKLSARLVREHGAIFVGNVNSSAMIKTRMAKSVVDAGWSQFRNMLEYKAIRHQVIFREVNEAFSTQTCSCCGAIPDSSPKGRAGLGIRQWDCGDCGAVHDRDINAALNIARRGLATLAEGA